jgi:hypothetical protein
MQRVRRGSDRPQGAERANCIAAVLAIVPYAEALPLVKRQQSLDQRSDDLLVGKVFDTLRVQPLDEFVTHGGHVGEVARDQQGCECESANLVVHSKQLSFATALEVAKMVEAAGNA